MNPLLEMSPAELALTIEALRCAADRWHYRRDPRAAAARRLANELATYREKLRESA